MKSALDGSLARPDHAVDSNRDGAQEPSDLLRQIDLLIGGDAYPEWKDVQLPDPIVLP